MSLGIENVNELLLNELAVIQTIPAFSVIYTEPTVPVSTSKETTAFAALLDLGVYPIFLAKETTFSLRVALSIKHSFATILVLYEAMYVLYARVSIIVDRLEPSKS